MSNDPTMATDSSEPQNSRVPVLGPDLINDYLSLTPEEQNLVLFTLLTEVVNAIRDADAKINAVVDVVKSLATPEGKQELIDTVMGSLLGGKKSLFSALGGM